MNRPTLIKLFKSLPKMKSALFWMSTTTIVINLTGLVLPIFFMQVYDRIIPNSSYDTLIYISTGAILLIVLEIILSTGRGIISNWYSSLFSYKTSVEVINSLFNKNSSLYKTTTLSKYFQSFRSIDKLRKIYSSQLFQTLLDIPFIFIYLFAIYYISGKLVIFHLAVLGIYVTYILISHRLIGLRKEAFTNSNNRKFDFLRTVLLRVHPLKASGFEESIIRKLERVLSIYSREYFLNKNTNSKPHFISGAFSQLIIYGTIVFGGILFTRGELSLGIISAVTMLARRSVKPIVSIYKLSLSIAEAKQDLKDLDHISKVSKKVRETTPTISTGNIELRNIFYNSSKAKIKDISISLNRHATTGILTTDNDSSEALIDMILGIVKPDDGDVIIDSIKVSSIDTIKELPGVSVIYEDPVLFSGTLLENITLFNSALNLQAFNIASYLEMDKLVSKLPKGYETQLDSNSKFSLTSELVHKISVARAITIKPKILILFNAEKYMNNELLKVLKEIVSNLKNRVTILTISSNPRFIAQSDRTFTLQDSTLKEVIL